MGFLPPNPYRLVSQYSPPITADPYYDHFRAKLSALYSDCPPHGSDHPRNRPIRLILLSTSRPATTAVHAALEILGIPCYRYDDLVSQPADIRFWRYFLQTSYPKHAQGLSYDLAQKTKSTSVDKPRPQIAHKRFESAPDSLPAVEDEPVCFLGSELEAAFPQAKFLIVQEATQRWYEALSFLNKILDTLLSRIGPFWRLNNNNPGIQAQVPQERLLMYELGSGWEPLCAFLGCEVPVVLFPRIEQPGDNRARAELTMQSFFPGSGPWSKTMFVLMALWGMWWVCRYLVRLA
ncbi:hypothetical protein MBLNU230_g0623t1 [Neophaeotheca triangularis]